MPNVTTNFDIDRQNKDGLSHRCKTCRSTNNKRWYRVNKEKVKIQTKTWTKNNPEKDRNSKLNWLKRNKDKRKVAVLKYHLKTRTTPEGRINDRMAAGIYQALQNKKAGRHWETLVGYTVKDMQLNFESKYYNGMSWDSFKNGGIDIHHIKPKHTFHFKTAEDLEFKACWALSNLQPLWKKDHIKIHKE